MQSARCPRCSQSEVLPYPALSCCLLQIAEITSFSIRSCHRYLWTYGLFIIILHPTAHSHAWLSCSLALSLPAPFFIILCATWSLILHFLPNSSERKPSLLAIWLALGSNDWRFIHTGTSVPGHWFLFYMDHFCKSLLFVCFAGSGDKVLALASLEVGSTKKWKKNGADQTKLSSWLCCFVEPRCHSRAVIIKPWSEQAKSSAICPTLSGCGWPVNVGWHLLSYQDLDGG